MSAPDQNHTDSQFTIVRNDSPNGGALVLTMADRTGKGVMTFSKAGDAIRIVDHTEVDETLRGTGAGQALAKRMVQEALADGVSLIPLCPFFLAVSKKHPEWHDTVRMPKTKNQGSID